MNYDERMILQINKIREPKKTYNSDYIKSAANMVLTAPKLERSSSKSWLSDSTA